MKDTAIYGIEINKENVVPYNLDGFEMKKDESKDKFSF